MKDSMTFEEQVEQIAEALLADFPGQKSKTEFRGLRYEGASVCLEGQKHSQCAGATRETTYEVHQMQLQLLRRIQEEEASPNEKIAKQESERQSQEAEGFQAAVQAAIPFDPAPIAETLRRLGDQFNADLERPAQEVIEAKGRRFKENIETLSKNWTFQNPELEYEKAFLLVAVKLFIYIAKKARGVAQPRLLTEAINAAPEVRHYIERQGGWENLENRRGQNNP